MKLVHLAMLSTSVVIGLGLAMIIPAYTQQGSNSVTPSVMLSFNILDTGDVSTWCQDLASTIEKNDIKATVFLSGKTAEQSPECVTSFSSDIDIGSQTYSFVNLTSIDDYSLALQEVREGKRVIDDIGNLNSRLFRAPYGSTDQNIYSLLSRSDIIADFSYESQYNKYENELFIKYDLVTYGWNDNSKYVNSSQLLQGLLSTNNPVVISFDSSVSVAEIDNLISNMKSDKGLKMQLVNASELVGIDLTIRHGEGN